MTAHTLSITAEPGWSLTIAVHWTGDEWVWTVASSPLKAEVEHRAKANEALLKLEKAIGRREDFSDFTGEAK